MQPPSGTWRSASRTSRSSCRATVARDREKLDALRTRPDIRVRGDANNLWDDAAEAIEGIASLEFPFFAIEEPIAPNQYAELVEVATALDTRIVLDESFLRMQQLAALADHPHAWIVNVRVSKMGGLLRSLAIVDQVRKTGTGLIVGARRWARPASSRGRR